MSSVLSTVEKSGFSQVACLGHSHWEQVQELQTHQMLCHAPIPCQCLHLAYYHCCDSTVCILQNDAVAFSMSPFQTDLLKQTSGWTSTQLTWHTNHKPGVSFQKANVCRCGPVGHHNTCQPDWVTTFLPNQIWWKLSFQPVSPILLAFLEKVMICFRFRQFQHSKRVYTFCTVKNSNF